MSQASRAITFAEFQSIVAPSPPAAPVVSRVEIEIDPASLTGGLKALEVEIQQPQDVNEEEEIKNRIVASDAAAGTITLELGIKVNFSELDTEFKDNLGMKLAFADFVTAVSGATPSSPVPVKVERPAKNNPPQAPDDPTFIATEIKLVDAVAEPEIEINVDADNLDTGTGKCNPVLAKGIKVLGLCIDISQAEQAEQLKQEVEVEVAVIPGAVVEFQDRVVDVNVTERTFTLASGTLVQVTSSTVIDPLGDLFTLAQVESSLADKTKTVRAEGDATVAAVGPPVRLEATDVKFEVDQ